MICQKGRVEASFRDPSGFLFYRDGELFRQVNLSYKENYEFLLASGLYHELNQNGWLISHEEINIRPENEAVCYKVVKPERVEFISYPYEWCFSQLKDAASLTLMIQRKALSRGMSLKDASAYNVQFVDGKPVLIDTLSFERYQDGRPWIAYRQFCQHFLAPLALMAFEDERCGRLLSVNLDGLPLDLVSKMLPLRSWWNSGLLAHLHLHAKAQSGMFQSGKTSINKYKLDQRGMLILLESLEMVISSLAGSKTRSNWQNYYQDNNYTNETMAHKQQIVREMLAEIKPKIVWDLGANTGEFSKICAAQGINIVAFDSDHGCVEYLYRSIKQEGVRNLLPLVMDFNNPSPALGWHNRERMSLIKRGPADMVLALALIHHLAIMNNVPLNRIAELLADITESLIIEFVPKDDSQIKTMLFRREDIFADYNMNNFERQFSKYFHIMRKIELIGSSRNIYLMKRK